MVESKAYGSPVIKANYGDLFPDRGMLMTLWEVACLERKQEVAFQGRVNWGNYFEFLRWSYPSTGFLAWIVTFLWEEEKRCLGLLVSFSCWCHVL